MNVSQALQQALSFHQQGQLDKAQLIYQNILRNDKKQSDAHNLLGALYVAKKEFKQAEKHLQKAAKLAPKYAPIHYNLGKCYSEAKQPKQALQSLNKSLRLDTNNPEALFLLANTHIQLGQHELALPHYQKLLVLMPEHVEGLTNLANAYNELKHYEEAVTHYQRALTIAPDHQPASLGLATSLANLDQQTQALGVLDAAIAITPHALLFKAKGNNHKQLGEMVAAKAAFKQAVKMRPTLGGAYRSFSDIAKTKQQEDIDFVESGFRHLEQMSNEEKMHLYFAWGNMQDSVGNYAEAITAYNHANQLKRQSHHYRHGENKLLFQTIQKTYNQSWFDKLKQQNKNSSVHVESDKQLIFILGMPRSGTTLVEQIISSHSLVTGAGELPFLGNHAKLHKQGANHFHQQFANMSTEQWHALAQNYQQQVALLAPDTTVVTDKMPHNFLNLGMIMALFPNAKIVHCKRHPVANCLSIYKQYFSAKNSHLYAYQQTELAQYHNLYEDLMQHWRQVMGECFYEVSYETLTTYQEDESRKLIDYCGLAWEDACLDFYKTKRKVKTASAFQVRQPISTKSIDLWQKYGDGLQPLLDALYIPDEYQGNFFMGN